MTEPNDIAHIIQLAVAPVFLLAGIGALLSVVTARLGRVVDRARELERALTSGCDEAAAARVRNELNALDKRMLYAQRSIGLCTIAALFICVVVASLFIGQLAGFNASAIVALLFVAAMLSLIGGLLMFLGEITVATRTLRVRAELLMK